MVKTEGILSQIGNTPLVKTTRLVNKPNVELFLKLEGNNPGGSVKDRAAYNMIAEALKKGVIREGGTLVEATSGNTGIALAYVAQLFGLKIKLVMPETATIERVKTMKAYGAEVILTSSEKGIEGSRDIAFNMRDEKGYVLLNQFENNDNWKAHYKTTGPEIWRDTNGAITHFVSAMGTTGTIMGTSTFLKEQNNTITIVGAQPEDGSRIPGIRKWSPDYVPGIFNPSKVDKIIEVNQTEAIEMSQRLAKEEGIFAGMSSGGSVASALKLIETIEEGLVVAVICDRGDRYLSSPLFDEL
ncbi:cysteine synthase CysM [uncultured Lacinutrix sp.]|uniref:cysteine synthase CysM n=1 Tax=uncultured Lacinutrix sp. TaxID=574032 RepID=UPI0026310319|nr:cysteine synthase CysM [uncultured Lacinutrix sp.]